MDRKHRGAASELLAVTWLLEQGYDVFRNVSYYGPADLIAVNFDTKETLYVDVKTLAVKQDGSWVVPKPVINYNKRYGVRWLGVNGSKIGWVN